MHISLSVSYPVKYIQSYILFIVLYIESVYPMFKRMQSYIKYFWQLDSLSLFQMQGGVNQASESNLTSFK